MRDETWLQKQAERADEHLATIDTPGLAARVLLGRER